MLRFTHRLFGSRLHTQTMVLCHLSLYMTCLEHYHQHKATRERDKGPDRRKCTIFLASCYLTQAMGLRLKWGLCNSMGWLYSPWNSLGQNTGVGSLSLLQGIFPTQGLNPGLPRCRQILYQLSHKESPRILEWVAYPLSSGSPWPRNWTGVSCIAGRFFTNWAIREAHCNSNSGKIN